MFARTSAAFILALPLVAAGGDPASQCDTGALKCTSSCRSRAIPRSLGSWAFWESWYRVLTFALPVGCSPLSVIGIGGNSCSAQPVCCTGNDFVRVLISFVSIGAEGLALARSHCGWLHPRQPQPLEATRAIFRSVLR